MKKQSVFSLSFLALVFSFGGCFLGCTPKEKPVTVGAFYFDGWAGKHKLADDPNEAWAKNAPTHLTKKMVEEYSDREPLWGWRDDTQEIMEQQIDLAADNGVDFFLFCWYWRDGRSSMNIETIKTEPLHTSLGLYRKAKNKKRLKYCLLVANADGEIAGNENWTEAVRYWKQYFNDPQYITVDGKPLIIIFGQGSKEPLNEGNLAIMQQTAKEEGFSNGLSIAACGSLATDVPGFNISTNYNGAIGWGQGTESHPYKELVDNAEKKWKGSPELPHIPLVNAGADYRPWEVGWNSPPSWYFLDNTPAQFKNFLGDAVHWMNKNPEQTTKERIVLIYAWNELGEGGYLVPTKGDPEAGKLKVIKEAVKAVK